MLRRRLSQAPPLSILSRGGQDVDNSKIGWYSSYMHPFQERLLEQMEKVPNLGTLPLRDIGNLIGTSSPQVVKHHLEQLERRGLIVHDRNKRIISRIRTTNVGGASTFVTVPILGYANCGVASEIAGQRPDGYLRVSTRIVGNGKTLFAIRAVGNSLNRASIGKEKKSIETGDLVLVNYSDLNPGTGDYVVSIIDGLANIKKYYFDKTNNQIVLTSESSQDFDPIYIHPDDNYQIAGKVVGVLKKPTD